MIDVLLLGTGAMMPLPYRPLSSLLLRSEGSLILFDCGEGTQTAWRTYRWGFKRLDAICLSHLHADHVAGLPGLFHTVANAGRIDPLHIYGPVGTTAVVSGLRVIAPTLPYEIHVHELADGETFALPAEIEAQVAYGEHRVPVIGYRLSRSRSRAFDRQRAASRGVPPEHWSRLQQGETVTVGDNDVRPDDVLGPPRRGVAIGFITDTRPTGALRELIRDVDLLISEATYGDDADTEGAAEYGHMTFREAATLARDAQAGHLWLTHFGVGLTDPAAWLPNATDVFPDTTVGHPGLTGTLTFRHGYQQVSDNDTPEDQAAS